ncbi:copper amine oxidase N-terminal domain-containing protein [Oscillospiraceae bacterium WX1]
MKLKKGFVVLFTIFICIIVTNCMHAAKNISVVVDNNLVVFDTPPYIVNGQVLVPLRDIAEAAGMKVDYDENTRTATITKTEKLMKIPLDSTNPYVDGKTHIVTLTLNSDTATVDGSTIQLDVPAMAVRGSVMVPLRFIFEAMDMDVIWSSIGAGVLDGKAGFLIGTRLRGSAPLAGESLFPTVSPEIISVIDSKGNTVSLGMDVTEMQQNLGEPAFVWGRGVPSPQSRYEYGENISSTADIGNAYAEIGCSLGKVTVIQLGPGSGANLKTGTGVAVGDPASSIAKAYDGSESYLQKHDANGHIILAYIGNTLKYAVSISGAVQSDYSDSDITHVIDFIIKDDRIEAIAITDIVSAREL